MAVSSGSSPGNPIRRLEQSLNAFNTRPKHTTDQYLAVARRFLRAHGPRAGQEAILSFIGELESSANKQFVLNVVRKLYQASSWEWPLPPRMAPKVNVTDQKRVKLARDDIIRMIRAYKGWGDERLPLHVTGSDIRNAAYVALSTIYGFRRDEMARMTRDMLGGLDGDILTVRTAKTGVVRTHRIPAKVLPYVKALPEKPCMTATMGEIFWKIASTSQLKLEAGSGWHSIRRTLVSELAGKAPDLMIVKYMGWQQGSHGTLMVYANPDPAEIDKAIYPVHPFLKEWETV